MLLLFLTGNHIFRVGQTLHACLAPSSYLTGNGGSERLSDLSRVTLQVSVGIGAWAQG